MQIYFDSDPEPEGSVILTPSASDSDFFDDILESDSLGERSTTSTVPTHNIFHIRYSGTDATSVGSQKLYRIVRAKEEQRAYSGSALAYIRMLFWVSITFSTIFTLSAVFPWLGSGYVFRWYYAGSGICHESTERTRSQNFLCSLTSIFDYYLLDRLKPFKHQLIVKRRILTQFIFPYYDLPSTPSLWTTDQWIRLHTLEYPAQVYLVFVSSFRHIFRFGGYAYVVLVASNIALAESPWFLTNVRNKFNITVNTSAFCIHDLELAPVLAMIGSIPWDYVIPRIFDARIPGLFDSQDMDDTIDSLRHFIFCGFWLRRVIGPRLMRQTWAGALLWAIYTLAFISWVTSMVYPDAAGSIGDSRRGVFQLDHYL
ncbi:hypothetical protein H072_9667 [Dactylellina haptotyla CBS 200.50]|uniref:Uncharacterized protein n=1 Tax=Dactylellina haptotyla (strain CBS 200.50) TaxID=1284197 RepID=S8A238_DACHA|nr:hypothetical protein H072_9667 [Dactylellina haptotyla CBS 200.50]